MEKFNVKHLHIPLGFTFSFPCKQEGLTSARLVNWTKGFKCTGVEGEDVVELLKNALRKRNVINYKDKKINTIKSNYTYFNRILTLMLWLLSMIQQVH